MQNEWILDVLTDLRTFAHQNGLPTLAEQLDDTHLLAASELASKAKGHTANERGTATTVGNNTASLGRRW